MRTSLLARLAVAAAAAAGSLTVASIPAGAHLADGVGPVRPPIAPPDAALARVAPASQGFELVGHEPLGHRGMNAALAVHNGYVYVGSRTDGQPHHRTPGVLVVDARNPRSPAVVHEIGQPDAGLVGETSRELRVWPQQNLLVVMNFTCSSQIHACAGISTPARFTFFDIAGENAARPKLVATYLPSRTPHEMFLWVDPARPAERALLFWTAPTTSTTAPSMVITDISGARQKVFRDVTWAAKFTAPSGEDRRLHSISVSNDGSRTYLAFLGSGFLVLDTSEVAAGRTNPVIRHVTEAKNRAKWGNPGAHTSARLYGRPVGLATDEVYGDLLDPLTNQPHGCPWGWVRVLDLADERTPKVISEYRVEENMATACSDPAMGNPANTVFSSFSSHNPTFTRDLAFVTWHSAGLEVIDLADPARPTRAGKFKPSPLPAVVTEDPALSVGLDKVVLWSYPVIADGLVYVVDLRNGLYILRYTGPRAAEVASIQFLEGNSNLGDALRFEPVEGLEAAGFRGTAFAV